MNFHAPIHKSEKINSYSESVSSLLFKIQKQGIELVSVCDGVDTIKISEGSNLAKRKQAVDVITSIDHSWVRVKDLFGDDATLFIVLGNDDSEILCDYATNSKTLMTAIEKIADEFCQQWEQVNA
jgi:Icc-related predicted phosphoesterase